jgi:eukaryotic-like serine/threonine-protein kinase
MSFIREANAEPIPGYRLIEPLGSGGFGEAWKCEAPGGLFKAIKFVYGNLNSLDVDGARAEQEKRALDRIKTIRHAFILPMDRIEVVEGELVIVMELADRNLHDAFEESVQAGLVGIPRDALLRYMRDSAEALDHMNDQHELQHLDIKPRNLFLVGDHVKVADFGLVKHLQRTSASGILGGVTPLYAPPETFSGAISNRSDQYSLAIVYQELLTGQRPYNGKNARLLAQQHMNEAPELRSLPDHDRAIVARALAKDPAKRFPSCLAFVRALYNATNATQNNISLPEVNNRPKSMSDTMDNLFLGDPGPDGDELVEVDLGEVPSVHGESELGLTQALPQTGALRPTIVIGLGNFGRRALMELRCRFLDRFGDLDKLPLLRFLYVDTDPDAVKASLRGSPEVSFKSNEVQLLPLQQVGHYRKRQIEQLNEWMPREKLYTMPRSLKPQGSRALARLSFADNYLRLMARIKREIQHVTHPDAIYQSVSSTGLALRDNVPRVYIIAAANGGNSGFLPDLGYATRRLLHQLRHVEAPVTAMLFCGAPDDPATPRQEQANLFATLTELNHFSDPQVSFVAQYGTDGPRLVDEGPPFDNTYLLTLENRSPESRRDAMAHLGSYLFHDLTTPLGIRLDASRMRRDPEASPFRSLGTYAVWFPRGLLLRLAAREACRRLIEEWQEVGEPTSYAELEAADARLLADPDLTLPALTHAIEEKAGLHMEGLPGDALTQMLATVEEQSEQFIAYDDPGSWARQALVRVKDWLGSGIQPPGTSTIAQRKSRLTKALENAAVELVEEWDKRLAALAYGLMQHPGRRVALAEKGLERMIQFCNESAEANAARLEQLAPRTKKAQQQLQTALDNCAAGSGGFSWFGNRSKRLIHVFMDHLAAYARQCLMEDMAAAINQFFVLLSGKLGDRLRDLTYCRQRLRQMQEALDYNSQPLEETFLDMSQPASESAPSPTPYMSSESFWETIRESVTTSVVLPTNETNLEHAAHRFLASVSQEHMMQLDQALQDHVLAKRGGLHKACMSTNDVLRHLAAPLVTHAVECLSSHLQITDVAQVEFSRGVTRDGDLAERVHQYHLQAEPIIAAAAPVASGSGQHLGLRSQFDFSPSPDAGEQPVNPNDRKIINAIQPTFLLIPASEAGKKYGELAHSELPYVHLVTVPGQADLMFCREQATLRVEDLELLIRACRPAYDDSAPVPHTSPHARFDVQEWTPLDP